MTMSKTDKNGEEKKYRERGRDGTLIIGLVHYRSERCIDRDN